MVTTNYHVLIHGNELEENIQLPISIFSFSIFSSKARKCVRAGAAGAQTRRSFGHHLLHPLILKPLVLCATAVLRSRALQDAPAPADLNS
jgi:hypothetical protein